MNRIFLPSLCIVLCSVVVFGFEHDYNNYYLLSDNELRVVNGEIAEIRNQIKALENLPYEEIEKNGTVCEELIDLIRSLQKNYAFHPASEGFRNYLTSAFYCPRSARVAEYRSKANDRTVYESTTDRDEMFELERIARGYGSKAQKENCGYLMDEIDDLEDEIDFEEDIEEQIYKKIYLVDLYKYFNKRCTNIDYNKKRLNIISGLQKSRFIIARRYGYSLYGNPEKPVGEEFKTWAAIYEEFPNTTLAASSYTYLKVTDHFGLCTGMQRNQIKFHECLKQLAMSAVEAYRYQNYAMGFEKNDQESYLYYYGGIENIRVSAAFYRTIDKFPTDTLKLFDNYRRRYYPGQRDPRNTLLGIPGTIKRNPPLYGEESVEEILRLNETPPDGYDLLDLIKDNELAKRAFVEAGWEYDFDGVDGPYPIDPNKPIREAFVPLGYTPETWAAELSRRKTENPSPATAPTSLSPNFPGLPHGDYQQIGHKTPPPGEFFLTAKQIKIAIAAIAIILIAGLAVWFSRRKK